MPNHKELGFNNEKQPEKNEKLSRIRKIKEYKCNSYTKLLILKPTCGFKVKTRVNRFCINAIERAGKIKELFMMVFKLNCLIFV